MLEKIQKRFVEFQKHPITCKNPFFSFLRYFYFNSIIKVKSEIKISWLNGLKLYIRKGDAAIVGNFYFKLADFSDSMFVLNFLDKDDLFLDIGANLGHFSLLASGVAGAKSICFEPVPSTYNQLKRIIELNKLGDKIQIHNAGLSQNAGELWFSSNKNNMNHVVGKEEKGAIKVLVNSLDNFIALDRPTLLKIDVEGYEKFVLDGASTILNSKYLLGILIELNGSGKRYNVNEEEIHLVLIDLGFRPFEYFPDRRELQLLATSNHHSFNTIYLRDEETAVMRLRNSRKIKIGNSLY